MTRLEDQTWEQTVAPLWKSEANSGDVHERANIGSGIEGATSVITALGTTGYYDK